MAGEIGERNGEGDREGKHPPVPLGRPQPGVDIAQRRCRGSAQPAAQRVPEQRHQPGIGDEASHHPDIPCIERRIEGADREGEAQEARADRHMVVEALDQRIKDAGKTEAGHDQRRRAGRQRAEPGAEHHDGAGRSHPGQPPQRRPAGIEREGEDAGDHRIDEPDIDPDRQGGADRRHHRQREADGAGGEAVAVPGGGGGGGGGGHLLQIQSEPFTRPLP